MAITAEINPTPGAVRVVPQNAEELWPHWQKDLLRVINGATKVTPPVNPYDIKCINSHLNTFKDHHEFAYKSHKLASPQYSEAYASWIIKQYANDARFFQRMREEFKKKRQAKSALRGIRMKPTILTVGHSNHDLEHFLRILRANQVTAVADIRSEPYSGYNPQFGREALKSSLETAGINYVFLGDELGAHPKDSACYNGNKVQYELMAKTPLFKQGLKRVVSGSEQHRIALMCAEKEPLECHRSVLISRELEALGVDVSHILEDGTLESQDETMNRLLEKFGLGGGNLFRTRDQVIEDACALQEQKEAYVNTSIQQ